MTEIRYTQEHEWLKVEGDVATVGITDFAQEQLGDIVYVELPEVDQEVAVGDNVVTIESVKAAGEINAPVAGVVIEINEALVESPETVNQDASGEGWFYRIKLDAEADPTTHMDQAAYDSYLESC